MMQGAVLFPVYLLTVMITVSTILFFFLSFYNIVCFSHSVWCHRAGSAHNALGLWLSLVFPLVKFFGFDWCCWSALHDAICLSLCLGRSQSLQEGYIHWLMPAGAALLVTWSGAATQ